MKACEDPSYDGQFPEDYNWNLLDSIKLSQTAVEFARQIKAERSIQPVENRINTPGLRSALRRISTLADV